MKVTQYFRAMRQRPDRAAIRYEWIQRVIHHPTKEIIQTDGRIRRWGAIKEAGGRHFACQTTSGWRDRAQRFLRSVIQAMKIQYFQDTDTLYIEFKPNEIAVTKDLDENTLLDVDEADNICAITLEHASQRADSPRFSYELVAA